jgi:hypothetical protein
MPVSVPEGQLTNITFPVETPDTTQVRVKVIDDQGAYSYNFTTSDTVNVQ